MQETTNNINISNLLNDELKRRRENNTSYSLRAFARDMKVHPSDMSKIIKGKRKVGPKLMKHLTEKLGLSAEEVASLYSDDGSFQGVNVEDFLIISDWYHYAILEVLELDDFEPTAKYITEKLGITELEANSALVNLEKAGMIKMSPGKIEDMTMKLTTTTNSPFTSKAFKNLQKGILKKAYDAMDEVPFDERDQSSVTFVASKEKLNEAKDMIKDFRRKLATFLSDGETKDTVYNLSLSLYPVTKN